MQEPKQSLLSLRGSKTHVAATVLTLPSRALRRNLSEASFCCYDERIRAQGHK